MENIVKCLMDPCISFLKGPISDAFQHLSSCEGNMESLEKEMSELEVKKTEMERMLEDGEISRTDGVNHWFTRANQLIGAAEELKDGHTKMLKVKCLVDISPNVWAIYRNSTGALTMIKSAQDLAREFSEVIDAARPLGPYMRMPSGSMAGRDSEYKKLEELATDDKVSIIGIYGMGGVGKTILLDKFYNETPLRFTHWIIRVNMEGCHTVEDAQLKLLDKLHLAVIEKENEETRAYRLIEHLGKSNFVLILDNVWKEVDLKVVGVPIDMHQTKPKVIVATRIERVCNRMNAENSKIHIKCLHEEEAWSLFAEKVGVKLVESPRIRPHAKILVGKCGGLPLALVNIGQSMAGKNNPKLWKHVITTLEDKPLEVHGMKDVINRLKLSYDDLTDDRLKTCLLYCTLYPEGWNIYEEWIVDYCIGEGIFDDQFRHGGDIYNDGHYILETLMSASMLEPGSDYMHVKMHPMARVVVIWVHNSTGGRKCLVRAKKELEKAPEVDQWKMVERASLMHNKITKLTDIPTAPSLLVLFLHHNPLVEICGGFFQTMKNLRVLELSHTEIEEVPAEIGELVHLQYLDFCDTKITSLPLELGNLRRLRYFLLGQTPTLKHIPEGLFEKLVELRVLYMYEGFSEWNVELAGQGPRIDELCKLKRLKSLGISVSSPSAWNKLADSNQLAQCIRELEFRECPGVRKIRTTVLANCFRELVRLRIHNCRDLEEFSIDHSDELSARSLGLTNLVLSNLPKTRITWSSGSLPELGLIGVYYCKEMTQLIHCTNESNEEEDEKKVEVVMENVLPNLYNLGVVGLPKLKSLSCGSRPLAFPSLIILYVKDCPKLKKLPLNAEKLGEIHGRASWWRSLEWRENEGEIKSKLQSSFVELRS